MRQLIKNAKVVLSTGIQAVSVVMEGSRIADIDPAVQLQVDEVIDASGLHHLNITGSPAVRALVLARVLETVRAAWHSDGIPARGR